MKRTRQLAPLIAQRLAQRAKPRVGFAVDPRRDGARPKPLLRRYGGAMATEISILLQGQPMIKFSQFPIP